MITVLFATPALWDEFHPALTRALARLDTPARLVQQAEPAAVDYIIYAPASPLQDFSPYVRCKAVLNLWAGVERIVGNPTLTQPLCRMVDPALTAGMVEWVTGQVLRHHLGLDRHIVNTDHAWVPVIPPLARERPVSMLGMGALGLACARALMTLGFPVTGWSRTEKSIADLPCLHGEEGLATVLGSAQIVVTLLPLTPETENLMNAARLALLPRGAVLINPGRGGLIDDTALLAALDSGQLAHATLDVFRTEPLPKDHPFWAHPQVTVSPHVAADTRPDTSAEVIVENIRRGEAGEPFLHLVDRAKRY